MLAVNSVRTHKTMLMAAIGFAAGCYAKNTADNSKDDFSVADFEFSKFKSLVDIRQEWLRKLYPEKDVFIKKEL